MAESLDPASLDQLFRAARTHYSWQQRDVPDALLRELYELVKFGPTSANMNPARFIFLKSTRAKERLRPALSPGNVDKTMTAPVVVIVAYDLKFFDKAATLFPHNPAIRENFANNPQLVEVTARRNSSLQGAYLMLGARALGLDCGPMSGFDNAKVDEEFFAAGRPCDDDAGQEFFPEGHLKSNFLINLGYGDGKHIHPRSPRLPFEEACSIL